MRDQVLTKSVVSVSEMARMVGLSRARFYQLLGTAFPMPVYDPVTRRPFFTEEQQRACLEVRRRNCGIDGKPILFYAARSGSLPVNRRKPKVRQAEKSGRYSGIVEGVRALGYVSAAAAQVEAAIREQFPAGTEGVPESEVIRAVFVRLMRQNRADNVR